MNQSGDESNASPFEAGSKQYLESAIFTGGKDLEVLAEWTRDCNLVLDVGAGTLHTAGHLQDEGLEVVGVDPSRPMLRDGLTRYEAVRAVAGRSERLPFAPDSFDGVVCRYAAHHFTALEPFFDEVRRVLGPDGVFAVQDIAVPDDQRVGDYINRIACLRDPSHEFYRSVADWKDALESAGWALRGVETFRLSMNFEDWLDRADPPAEAREQITALFEEMPEEVRDRINLVRAEGQPREFEYPVAMFCSRA